MRRIIFSVLTAVTVGAGTPAAADPFADFKQICLDTDGDRASALAIVDADHWIRFDPSKVPGFNTAFGSDIKWESVDLRLGQGDGGGLKMLMVAKGVGKPFPGEKAPSPIAACAVFVIPSVQVKDAVSQWAAVPPFSTNPQTMYAFLAGPNGHEPVPVTAQMSPAEEKKILQPLINTGRLRAVAVGDFSTSGTMMMFMAISGSTKTP